MGNHLPIDISNALEDQLKACLNECLTGEPEFDDAIVHALYTIKREEQLEWSNERTKTIGLCTLEMCMRKSDAAVIKEGCTVPGIILAAGRDPEVFRIAYKAHNEMNRLESKACVSTAISSEKHREQHDSTQSDTDNGEHAEAPNEYAALPSLSSIPRSFFERRDLLDEAEQQILTRCSEENTYSRALFYDIFSFLLESMSEDLDNGIRLIEMLSRMRREEGLNWSHERKNAMTAVNSMRVSVRKDTQKQNSEVIPFTPPQNWEEMKKEALYYKALAMHQRLCEMEAAVFKGRPFTYHGNYKYEQITDQIADLENEVSHYLESLLTGVINYDISYLWSEFILYDSYSERTRDPIWEAIFSVHGKYYKHQKDVQEQIACANEDNKKDLSEQTVEYRRTYEEIYGYGIGRAYRRREHTAASESITEDALAQQADKMWCLAGDIEDGFTYDTCKERFPAISSLQPGSPVYCFVPTWDDFGAGFLVVVGREIGTERLIKLALSKVYMRDYRVVCVEDEEFFKRRDNELAFHYWSSSAEARVLIQQLASRLNKERALSILKARIKLLPA